MDDFEKYISENKDQFDDLEPSGGLWDKIDDALDDSGKSKVKTFSPTKSPKMVSVNVIWRMAAAFALILVGLWNYQSYIFSEKQKGNESYMSDNIDTQTIAPELAETERYYYSLISEKISQIKKFQLSPRGLETESSQELQNLDAVYNEMKAELLESHKNEKVINAMIMNLQLRIEILNQELEVLEQINKKGQSNEKINI